nr:ABC transporter substrate-binding protein [Veronia nyctiphanis]
MLSSIIFDQMGYSKAGQRLFSQGLSKSVQLVSAQENTWEISIHKGITFHDGHELTSEDVAFTINRIKQLPDSDFSFKPYVEPILEVKVKSLHTIRLKLKPGYSEFHGDLSKIFILPAHLEHSDSTDTFDVGKSAIGTGTYRIRDVGENKNTISLEHYKNNWRNQDGIRHIELIHFPDAQKRFHALLQNEIHVADKLSPQQLSMLEEKGYNTLKRPSTRMVFLQLDTHRDISPFITDKFNSPLKTNPLKSLKVRQAMSLALDRDTLQKR